MRSRRRTWLAMTGAGYLIGALIVGLWPTPVDAGLRIQIAQALGLLHSDGLPSGFGYAALEFTANIAFFVPIGLVACLLFPRRFWYLAIAAGALLSGTIELSQLLLLPARYASWGDILANTTGTVIGVALVLIGRGIRSAVGSQLGDGVPRLR